MTVYNNSPRDIAIKRKSRKEAYVNNHDFFETGGETFAVMKPKTSKLQKLEKALLVLQDHYNVYVKNGKTESAAECELAIKKYKKQIAKMIA